MVSSSPLNFAVILLLTIVFAVLTSKFFLTTISAQTLSLNTSATSTSSQVTAPNSCVKNSNETYAVCAGTYSSLACVVKYSIAGGTFSYIARKAASTAHMHNVAIYDVSDASKAAIVYRDGNNVKFIAATDDLSDRHSLSVGIPLGNGAQVVVDSANHFAYVSNYQTTEGVDSIIVRIRNLDSTPEFDSSVVISGMNSEGNLGACAMILAGGDLFVAMNQDQTVNARLVRVTVNSPSFDYAATVFFSQEWARDVLYQSLNSDDNFIYVVCKYGGVFVKVSYKSSFEEVYTYDIGAGSTYSTIMHSVGSGVILAASQATYRLFMIKVPIDGTTDPSTDTTSQMALGANPRGLVVFDGGNKVAVLFASSDNVTIYNYVSA